MTIPAIRAEGLTKIYRADSPAAVSDLNFVQPAGATWALLGGNGAGKSTTIAMLLGLLEPSAGRVTVLGHDMARDRFAALARMNFSSPYVALPHRLTVSECPRRGSALRPWLKNCSSRRFSTARRASFPPGRKLAWRWRSP